MNKISSDELSKNGIEKKATLFILFNNIAIEYNFACFFRFARWKKLHNL